MTLIGFVFVSALCACDVKSGIAPAVTAERIRAVQIGMSDTRLKELLGSPLDTRRGAGGMLWFYSHEIPFVNHSPTLWVLVADGLVKQVEAKRTVMFVDDEGLYVMREGLLWESPAFAKTFK
jgi:hypothetical protein